ncbi:glycosyl hydrolase family 28-related protein [Tardiphaga sp. P5_C7]
MTITSFQSSVLVAHEVSPSPPGFEASSSTSMTIGTGSKTFLTRSGLAYKPGARVRLVSAADPSDYMEGDITAYAGTSMTVNVTYVGRLSSGTFADWSIVIAGIAPAGFEAASITSMAIGTGSKTFTTQSGLAYKLGARVRLVSALDPTDYMEGDVTAYAGTSMTVNVTRIGPTSSGTAADWSIVIAGDPGSGDILSSLNGADFDDPAEVRENLGIIDGMFLAAARSNLKATDTGRYKTSYLSEEGRSGIFVWRTGNYSARIAADTEEGIYIKATAISASVGAWVRSRTEGVYDVKWFGAKGDNTTNDYAAIQAAINLCQFHAGGDVLFSQGGYVIGTGLTVTAPLVRLIGVGQKYCSIVSTTLNLNVVTISAARCSIEKLSLFENVQCNVASAVITLASGAVQCTLDALDVVGGYYCFRALAGSADNVVNNCVMRLSTGGAISYTLGAGTVFFKRCLFNQDWPISVPSSTNDKGARSVLNNFTFAAGDFCTSNGFLLQCATGGISAASPPSLAGKWYGQPITDGGATFYLAGHSAGVAVLVDSGCLYIQYEDCDFTGAFNYGAQVVNNLGTTPPDVTRFVRCTTGGFVLHGFYISATNRLLVQDCEIQSPVGNSALNTGIYMSSSVAGDVTIKGNQIVTAFNYGIWLDKSTTLGSALIEGNSVFGCTYGIYVSPGVKDFSIVGNNCGGSSLWGNNAAAITVAVGSSDYYLIAVNRVHGSTLGVSDGGTGVNKNVNGNV